MATIDEQLTSLKAKLTETINEINHLKIIKRRLEEAIAAVETVKESQGNPDFVDNLTKEFEE